MHQNHPMILYAALVAAVGCSSASGPLSRTQETRHRTFTASSSPLPMAYVVESTVNGTQYVAGYSLRKGIPEPSPAASAPADFTSKIATGPNGDLYVSSFIGSAANVSVYPPAPQVGATPLRTFQADGFALVVDSGGYTYMENGVYAPNVSGTPAPLQTFPPNGATFDRASIALDPKGNLYVNNTSRAVVYRTPVTMPTPIRTFCFPATLLSYAIAVGPDGTEYVGLNGHRGHKDGAILVYGPAAHTCPVDNPQRKITVTDKPLRAITGLAYGNGYLYAVDYESNALVVLNPSLNAQVPVARISTGIAPSAVAIYL